MKLLQTLLLVLAGLSINATAWADALDPRAQALKEQLKLSDKQTKELDKVFKETRAKQKALRKELQELHKKQREQVDAILTPEQKKQYEESTAEPPMPESPEPPATETPGGDTSDLAPEAIPQPAK